ncbi:DUF2007 domain-containing protein [bacterium]|nr:DUF2007 domain-containing protein [bacterium]
MIESRNPKDESDEPMVNIFTCSDIVESTVVQDALNEAGIPFVVNATLEEDPLGIIDGEHGEGLIAVLEKDIDRAIEVIHAALPEWTEIEEIDDDDEEDEDEDEEEEEEED